MYYDLNVQVWQDGDVFYYSVVQETEEAGGNDQPLSYGEADTLEDALEMCRRAVNEALIIKD